MNWTSLRQFTNWWWRSGEPYRVPADPFKLFAASCEFVVFRSGQFQVEHICLLPNIDVPCHSHPNVDNYECHLSGCGDAWIDGRKLPHTNDYDKHHPRARRVLIKAGTPHRGVAHSVNVVLSFQHWLNDTPPTFITADWIGEAWR